jgi:hypothetical protein
MTIISTLYNLLLFGINLNQKPARYENKKLTLVPGYNFIS